MHFAKCIGGVLRSCCDRFGCIASVGSVDEIWPLDLVVVYEVSSEGWGWRCEMFWFEELPGERGQVVLVQCNCDSDLRWTSSLCAMLSRGTQCVLRGKRCFCLLIKFIHLVSLDVMEFIACVGGVMSKFQIGFENCERQD